MHPERYELGDMLAFEGRGFTSGLIKWGQRLRGHWRWSQISHVAICVSAGNAWDGQLIESTTLSQRRDMVFGERVSGVQRHRIGPRLRDDNVRRAWRFPLRAPILYPGEFVAFLEAEHAARRPYDYFEAYTSWSILPSPGSASALFCSELEMRGLNVAGVMGVSNPSEYMPVDCCKLADVWGIPERVK